MASTDVHRGERDSGALPVPPAGAAWTAPWRKLTSSPRLRRAYAWICKPYEELPPAQKGLSARIALALVAAMAVAFVAFFTAYLWSQQNAYLTHAEDLGIMDQALWNTVHGAPLHQTICNIVSDANCLGDISRLAIHFEPIMFPISLLYLIAPSPKTLQLFQALVVATGAFPAYWLASRRLRSAFAGVVFAVAYLLFPSLEAAVTYDFHAVTLAAAFLMFALYFMLSRNNAGLVIACLLALSTKEEIVVDVAMIAICVLLFQRRWRLSAGLLVLSCSWLVLELAVMHAASPLGHSPTAGRYAYLGHGVAQAVLYLLTHPLQILREHVFTAAGILYLRILLAPVAYLAVLSPLTLVLAVPALGINLLSTDPSMSSGMYQYNAEIIPVLILSAIQAVAYLTEGAGWLARRLQPVLVRTLPTGLAPTVVRGGERLVASLRGALRLVGARRNARPDTSLAGGGQYFTPTAAEKVSLISRVTMVALVLLILFFGVYEQRERGYLPIIHGFAWPQVTAHDQLADALASMIPPDASVSAQSDLVPHVSHRRYVYLYPYHGTNADYVFLDVTGNIYPYITNTVEYYHDVAGLLDGGDYHVVAARDGYLLLARGPGAPSDSPNPFGLPDSFFTFTRLAGSATVPNPVDVRYGPALRLVGYKVDPTGRILVNTGITITTYWRVTAPLPADHFPQLVLNRQDGTQGFISDFAATSWLPMSRWQPGLTYAVTSWPLFVDGSDMGRFRIGVRVIDASQPGEAPAAIPPAFGIGAASTSIHLLDASQAVFFDQRITK